MKKITGLLVGTVAMWVAVAGAQNASAMSMDEAVRQALRTNPEIGQAIANREGVQFELEQGKGLQRPRVDLEASAGGELANNSTTIANGDVDRLFLRREASVVFSQPLYDGNAAKSEIERQAARVDSASFRVKERSEFIALAVIHEYIEMQRALKVIALAKENISYHERVFGEIAKGSGGGAISVADRQQAQERVYAARARLAEAEQDYRLSQDTFIKLVGRESGAVGKNSNLAVKLPKTLEEALRRAHAHHPSIKFAQADIDAASAAVRGAESKLSPKLSLEGRASLGQDLGGVPGPNNDLQGNLVFRWNLYNGGIDKANTQEQIRHVDEAYQVLHRITRETDEGVMQSWDRRALQSKRLQALLRDLSAITQLKSSYAQQFKIGQRSLLDLLDTQNNNFAVQVAVATADADLKFSTYRILASMGELLPAMGIAGHPEAKPYGRKDYDVPPTPAPESFARTAPTPPKG